MRILSYLAALFLVVPACGPAHAGAAAEQAAVLDVVGYQSELRRWSEALALLGERPEEAPTTRAAIPREYVVEARGRKLTVSNAWMHQALTEFMTAKPPRQAALLKQMQHRLEALAGEAEAFVKATDAEAERGRLREILLRREFRGVKGPSPLRLWLARLADRVARFLDRIFAKVGATELWGQVFVWALIAVAVATLAIYLLRLASRRETVPRREPVPFSPSAKHWRRWLAEAREAAQQGHWRNAIHLAYWAAVSHLEESGAWRPDKARTPREYLRLMRAEDERRQPLAALTRSFEVTWYGNRPAGAEEFRQAVLHLESLGCR